MLSTTASVSEPGAVLSANVSLKAEIFASIERLSRWLEENEYRGYDTFDGLSARFVRPLTLETKLLRTVLLQGVRRFPLNLRPVLGVTREHSSKGMGFLARGFIRLHETTGDQAWAEKARFALQWLMENRSPGYSGACWGNHFDYQSRGFYLPKGVPTVVWTALIGHAFLDAYDHFREVQYLQIATSACGHILRDLQTFPDGNGVCITYVPGMNSQVHNANTLGASLLARTYAHTHDESYRESAQKALQYTAQHQRPDSSWYDGEKANLHWVNNFHTAYVLDCFKYYADSIGDEPRSPEHEERIRILEEDFLSFLWNTEVLRSQNSCRLISSASSQAIDTLVFFHDRDADSLPLALKVAQWTIANMQDRTGYFYYRRYSPLAGGTRLPRCTGDRRPCSLRLLAFINYSRKMHSCRRRKKY